MRKAIARALLCAATALLAACGGGTTGDAPPASWPAVQSVSGTAYSVDDRLAPGDVFVKGTQGIFRDVLVSSSSTYTSKLDQLSGPYAAGLRVVSEDTGQEAFLVAFATGPGTANATPLSTLVAAELTGQDPTLYFQSLGATGGAALAQVTDAAIAAAEARVARRLARDFAITLPEGAHILSASSQARAGDPWFDAATALTAQLKAQGSDILAYARSVAQQAALCNAERLSLSIAGSDADFCPRSKQTTIDSSDETLAHYQFTAADGAVLAVDGRDTSVVALSFTDALGHAWSCAGTQCQGLGIGNAAGDGTRPLQFAVTLQGDAGTLVLSGSLTAPKPGAVLPPLPCDTNRYYVILPDDTVEATCAAPDSLLGTGVGDSQAAGSHRVIYRFATDGSTETTPPMLEVRLDDGNQVASVLVYDTDPDTSQPRPLYLCRGADCQGVTVDDPVDDTDSFAPYVIRMRKITLDHTVLAAIQPDGTPAAGGPASVVAELDSLQVIPPEPLVAQPCASPAMRLTAQASDESAPWDVCPPADPQGNDPSFFLSTGQTADGFNYAISSLYGNAFGSATGGPVLIQTAADAVTQVSFTTIDGVVYQCQGSACSGVTLGEPDNSGARLITVSGLMLTEVETGGLPGLRTVRVDGAFTAPPPLGSATAARRRPAAR